MTFPFIFNRSDCSEASSQETSDALHLSQYLLRMIKEMVDPLPLPQREAVVPANQNPLPRIHRKMPLRFSMEERLFPTNSQGKEKKTIARANKTQSMIDIQPPATPNGARESRVALERKRSSMLIETIRTLLWDNGPQSPSFAQSVEITRPQQVENGTPADESFEYHRENAIPKPSYTSFKVGGF